MKLNVDNILFCLIINGLIIFIFSFLLNFSLFYSIRMGLFGVKIKENFITYYNENSFLFIIIPFIASFLIFIYLGSNTILLDGKLSVIVETDDAEFEFSGDFFKLLLTQLGAAAVFSSSARLAAGLTAKIGGNLSLLPKIGIIGSTSTGFTATYLLLTQHIPAPTVGGVLSGKVRVKYYVGDNESATANLLQNDQGRSLFSKWLNDSGLCKINKISSYTTQNTENSQEFIVKMSNADKSRVIEELNKTDPNWRDQFIHSPLEKGDLLNSPFIQSINEIITINLILHFVILYLLFMLVMIFSCKVILDNNINFDKILNYPLGKYIHRFLTFYVNIWKTTANFWIYFILFCLIIFNFGIVISLYNILSAIH